MIKLGKYKHFKGNFYEVIGVARNSENLEEMVIYKALYESKDFGKNALWTRQKTIFLENIEKDGKIIPKFEFIGEM